MEGIIEKSSSNHKLVLDNYCKLIICHEEILSRIVKCFIDEAKHLTLNEIERLIKEKKSFQHLDKENFIPYSGKTNYDFLCTIDLSQRIYLNVEIQNDPNPGYSLITRGLTYISRIMTTQWKNEYYDYDYNHIKKVYSIWILPQSAKKNDGHINAYKIDEININGTTIERIETYDKGVLIMIYLNKEHDTNEKYIIYDNILTPLVAFLNNVLSYQEKRKIMKEYGFNVIDKEIEKMCNLGEMIEREAIQKTKQSERKNMLIYNTTYQVEEGQEDNFLIWIKEFYLPEVEKAGALHTPRIVRVLSHREEGSTCYSLQFEVENSGVLHRWHLEQGTKLNEELVKIFQDKVVGFPTLMEVIE